MDSRYNAAGVQFMDDSGTRDVTEFLNISKDDALAWPTPFHRTYPSTVDARREATIKPFMRKSLTSNHFLIDILNDRIGLPKGTLAAFHKADEASGCTARCIRTPPHLEQCEKNFLNPYTDFGSLVSHHSCRSSMLGTSTGTIVVPAQPFWGPPRPSSRQRQVALREGETRIARAFLWG